MRGMATGAGFVVQLVGAAAGAAIAAGQGLTGEHGQHGVDEERGLHIVAVGLGGGSLVL